MSKLLKQVRSNRLSGAIFEDTGKKAPTVTVQKSRLVNGEWQRETLHLFLNEIADLVAVGEGLTQAHNEILSS